MCKHILGALNRFGVADKLNINAPLNLDAEPNFDDEPLFDTNRGRPKKVTAALVVDN